MFLKSVCKILDDSRTIFTRPLTTSKNNAFRTISKRQSVLQKLFKKCQLLLDIWKMSEACKNFQYSSDIARCSWNHFRNVRALYKLLKISQKPFRKANHLQGE